MIEGVNRRTIYCPICGRALIRCRGSFDIQISCPKCNKELVILMDVEKISIQENQRDSTKGKPGAAKVIMDMNCSARARA